MFSEILLVAGMAQLAPPPSSACAATPQERRLSVIAPVAGVDPVWLVTSNAWRGATHPVKSAWVLSRRVPGDLTVRGKRLDGEGRLTFQRGLTGPITDTLTIVDPRGPGSMTPGGATADVMRDYAFVASYVFYPSPGCWELHAQLGAEERRIVVEVR